MKIEEKLAGAFLKDGVISQDEVKIVEYGLENLGSSLSGLLVTMLIGIYFDFAWGSFLLWLQAFPLRKNAGGFHAETKIRCLLFSTATIVVSMIGLKQMAWTETVYIWITLISAAVIWLLAPVENNNKRLDSTEVRVYRKRTRSILILEILLFVLALKFDWKSLIITTAMTFFIVCAVLLIGKGKILIQKNCENM